MAVYGALASVVSATSLIAAGQALGILATKSLIVGPQAYVSENPIGVGLGLIAYLAVSYALAWGAARLLYKSSTKSIIPGDSAWKRLPEPTKNRGTYATVMLRDGMQFIGPVNSVSLDEFESREIELRRPIRYQEGFGLPLSDLDADILVLREAEVKYVYGVEFGDSSPGDF
jgi:hypothetical protein